MKYKQVAFDTCTHSELSQAGNSHRAHGLSYPRPVITKPPPLNRDHNRDPNVKALKRKEFINPGSPLQ